MKHVTVFLQCGLVWKSDTKNILLCTVCYVNVMYNVSKHDIVTKMYKEKKFVLNIYSL